jgi:hypothetical protein
MNLQTNVFDGEIKRRNVTLCGNVCVVKYEDPAWVTTLGLMPVPRVAGCACRGSPLSRAPRGSLPVDWLAGLRWIGWQKSVEYAPEDKRPKIMHACDCWCAARIPLTRYDVKHTQVERVPVTSPP